MTVAVDDGEWAAETEAAEAAEAGNEENAAEAEEAGNEGAEAESYAEAVDLRQNEGRVAQ